MNSLSIPDTNSVFNHLYNVLLPLAVATMWFYFKAKADKCEADRQHKWEAILKLSGLVHTVKECPVNGCGLRKAAFETIQEVDHKMDPKEVKNQVMKELNINGAGPCYHVPA